MPVSNVGGVKRILLITRSYPPDWTVSARRWGRLVPELERAGISCAVVTAGDRTARPRRGSAGELIVPLPVTKEEDSPAAGRWATLPSRGRNWLLRSKPLLLDRTAYPWVSAAIREGSMLRSLGRDADCVISSYGPAGPLLAGWYISRETGLPWVLDIRDVFSYRSHHLNVVGRRLGQALEGSILRHTTLCLTVGERWSRQLRERYGADVVAIFNGWSAEDRIDATATTNSGGPCRYLLYAGTIYESQISALRVLVGALKHSNEELRLRIRLLRDRSGALPGLLRDERAEHLVDVLPPTSPRRIREEMRDSLGAVVLHDLDARSEWVHGLLTGKLLGLLASGKPGVVLAGSEGEIHDIVTKADGWYCVNSVDTCRDAIAAIVRAPRKIEVSSSLARFHMRNQADLLIKELNRRGIGETPSRVGAI